jgi:glycosyltransferase involved in cell wall biosynthesis
MKTLFLVDYYYPFEPGGAEKSTRYLVQQLRQRKIKASVFEFPKLIKNRLISPWWFINPLSQFYCLVKLLIVCQKTKPNLLHINAKYTQVSGFLVSKILKIPLIITLREYSAIKPYGFTSFKDFLEIYHPQANLLKKILLSLSALGQLDYSLSQRFVIRHADQVVCLSQAQADIYQKYIKREYLIIENAFKISSRPVLSILDRDLCTIRDRKVLFVGRQTYGKGFDLFIKTAKILHQKHPRWQFIAIGQPSPYIKTPNFIQNFSQIPHRQVLKIMHQSSVLIAPSRWPEPFGRIVIESFSQGTPVVVSDKGALPGLIETGKAGLTSSLNSQKFAQSIGKIIKNASQYQRYLQSNNFKNKLKNRFNLYPVKQYLKLYETLTLL